MAHVVFNRAAEGTLRQALSVRPLCLDDCLDIGPLVGSRADTWEYLNFDGARIAAIAEFWRLASLEDELVIWISSRNACELCGLHELVWRRRDAAISVIDVAQSDLRVARRDGSPGPHLGVGEIRPERIVQHDLPSRAVPLTDVQRARYVAAWDGCAPRTSRCAWSPSRAWPRRRTTASTS